LDVEIVQVPQQLWMDALHVVALVESIDGRFPVAVPFDGDVPGLHHLVEIVRLQVLRYGTQELEQRTRRLVQRVPDESAPGTALHFRERVRRLALSECIDVWNPPVRAIELVLPMVIRADERERGPRRAEPAGPEPVATMLAHVVKRAHALVFLPHDENRLRADLGDEVVSGLRNVQLPAAEQ